MPLNLLPLTLPELIFVKICKQPSCLTTRRIELMISESGDPSMQLLSALIKGIAFW